MSRASSGIAVSGLAALSLGIALTLCVHGYQFGRSNHTVYLLQSLRLNDPTLLANDWFATRTLGYHAAFAHVAAWLDRLGVIRPAFGAGYLALLATMHLAWLGIVRQLGGSARTYLLSVLLFTLSAGGAGLGVYDFLQDSCFLPSNVANVAMLVGLYCWIAGRHGWAGAWLGVAGFFHLNHAIVAIGLWAVLWAWDRRASARGSRRAFWVGSALLLAPCLFNIIPAARAAIGQRDRLPLREFVDLYVRLRHPHHYDPSSWPAALWVSFLWPVPVAIAYFRSPAATAPRRAACQVFLIFCGVLAVTLVFAGILYISEPLVQMSLYRFSIYPKLLSCIAAASWLLSRAGRHRLIGWLAAALAAAIVMALALPSSRPFAVENRAMLAVLATLLAGCAAYEGWHETTGKPRRAVGDVLLALLAAAAVALPPLDALGVRALANVDDPPDYLALCDYARAHTPVDAVFLVPPQEMEFRLRARRAIVVNYKGVGQLSAELREWRDRLRVVLGLPDLGALPRRYDRTLAAIGARYESRTAPELLDAADAYGSRYVIVGHALESAPPRMNLVTVSGRYHLYRVLP